jgi:hypothetical protein
VAESEAMFLELKKLLVPYAKHFQVTTDAADAYGLDEELPHHRTQFAHVTTTRRGVKLFCYPVLVFKELRVPPLLVPKQLASARSVFAFEQLTPGQRSAVKALLSNAWTLIEARRAESPDRPYHKP